MAEKIISEIFVVAESTAIILSFPIYCLGLFMSKK